MKSKEGGRARYVPALRTHERGTGSVGFLLAYTLPTNSRKWYVCGTFSNGGEKHAKPVKYGLSSFFIL